MAAELDLEKIVQTITDAGVELTGAQFGALFYNVVNGEERATCFTPCRACPVKPFRNFQCHALLPCSSPVSWAGVVRSDNIRLDARYGHNAPRKRMPEGICPVTSYLAVPVISRSGKC